MLAQDAEEVVLKMEDSGLELHAFSYGVWIQVAYASIRQHTSAYVSIRMLELHAFSYGVWIQV
jgi:hypothetical protein